MWFAVSRAAHKVLNTDVLIAQSCFTECGKDMKLISLDTVLHKRCIIGRVSWLRDLEASWSDTRVLYGLIEQKKANLSGKS